MGNRLVHLLSAAAVFGLAATGSASGQSAPYVTAPQFRPALNAAKLQAPTSRTAIPQGGFASPSAFNAWFYIPADGPAYLTFEAAGDGRRSELRQVREWDVASPTPNRMTGRVHLPSPTGATPDQYTFMQIHDSGALNKPLLRIAWLRRRQGVADHVWAIVRDDIHPDSARSSYSYVDLGPRGAGGRRFEVAVGRNRLTVSADGAVRISGRDVGYWSGQSSYFKAGVYLQSAGRVRVQFEDLAFGR